jgi:DNA-binding ferritin-like protein
MSFKYFKTDIISEIDSLAEAIEEKVDMYASMVRGLDEEIDATMSEYDRCSNINCRISFRDDLEELVGKRQSMLEDLYKVLEDGKDAIADVQQYADDVLSRLHEMEEDGDKVPFDDDYTIPDLE